MDTRADIKRKHAEEEKYLLEPGDEVGWFKIKRKLGKGKTTGAVYLACAIGHEQKDLALKFPTNDEELMAFREINGKAPNSLGVARLISWGHHTTGQHPEKPYVVMDLLKGSLMDLFEKHLRSQPLQDRWCAVQVLGRMLLRTLEGLHRCGLLHCDVQPNNLCSGDAGVTCRAVGGDPVMLCRPFLVDFGCARAYPSGKFMRADWGSVDFNSISAAQSGTRTPWDDLESLGWLLLHGLVGELPWFEITRDSVSWHGKGYWELHRSWRCGQVGQIKKGLLDCGFKGMDDRWKHLEEVPPELVEFLQLCHRRKPPKSSQQRGRAKSDAGDVQFPDYQALAGLLGASPDMDNRAAETQDLGLYWRCIEDRFQDAPLLELPEPATQETHGQLVPPATVVRWLEEQKCFAVDSRHVVAYKRGTLLGSVHIGPESASWENPNVKIELEILAKSQKPIVCFGDDSSNSCESVCRGLAQGRGLPEQLSVRSDRLFRLDGGFEAWMAGPYTVCIPGDAAWKEAFGRQRNSYSTGAAGVQYGPEIVISGLDGSQGLGGFAACGRGVHVRASRLQGMNEGFLSDVRVSHFDTEAGCYGVNLRNWHDQKLSIGVKAEDLMLKDPTGILWEIIGGAERGGIIVRADEDFLSEKLEGRLSFGAIVLQMNLVGKRLHYRLSVGAGPVEGWISISLEEKVLARKLP